MLPLSMKRSTRCALLVIAALAIGSHDGVAQQWMCQTIRQGDTAAHLAARMTGNGAYRHDPSFQILDPAASRFVTKARYDRIRPGWLACVLTGAGRAADTGTMAVGRPGSPASGFDSMLASIEPNPLWYVVIVFFLMMPLAWYAVGRRRRGRRAVVEQMSRFGQSVIREFERPLVHPRSPAPAVRSRLRVRPHRRRVEVLFAPAAGRTYPNLSDHRKNVEYDVRRVLQLLPDAPFISASLHQRGEWVVVSFDRVQKQEGAS
jgi:hypothetical protein